MQNLPQRSPAYISCTTHYLANVPKWMAKMNLKLVAVRESKNRWVRSRNGTEILLHGTKKCLTAAAERLSVVVSDECQSKNSSWETVSLSKLHLATTDQHEKQLCLQKDSNSSSIVTSKCICIKDDSQCLDDPQSQWFQLVATNV